MLDSWSYKTQGNLFKLYVPIWEKGSQSANILIVQKFRSHKNIFISLFSPKAQMHRKTGLGTCILVFIYINLGRKTVTSQQRRTDVVCPSQWAIVHFLPKSICHWIQEPFSAIVKNSGKPWQLRWGNDM